MWLCSEPTALQGGLHHASSLHRPCIQATSLSPASMHGGARFLHGRGCGTLLLLGPGAGLSTP